MSNQDLAAETQVSVNGVPVGTLKDVNDRIDAATGKGKKAKGAIPVELKDSKLFKAVVKETDKDQAAAILEKTDDELKMILAENMLRRDDLKAKLAANPEYAKACDIVNTLDGGLKSTMKGSDACAKLAKAVLKSRKG